MEIFTLSTLVEAGNISRVTFFCEGILNQICNVIVLCQMSGLNLAMEIFTLSRLQIFLELPLSVREYETKSLAL
ncbi:hypothetical protein [Okeania sp. SIO2B3]|uniref:hypothetical protein n=1 Tax=Okeania sp. SIO2B3 TaxID=2607784 RepID=UPI0013C04D28|nr:hypothetical protein [Okeania sp. SIO2B3]NET46298.1 hypothetical protein [Okeania sp. SIO2B3]